MAKNKVSEWSAVPANNTDIGGIDIAEGCAPSGINNAIREMMAQVKDMVTGTDGDSQVVGGDLSVDGNLSIDGTSTLTGVVTAPAGVLGNVTGNVVGNVTGNLVSVTNTITAGSFIIGNTYKIATIGSTNFTLIGASANTVDTIFIATGVGTGTGTATTVTGNAVGLTSTLLPEKGGTGQTSLPLNNLIVGNGSDPVTAIPAGLTGNILTSSTVSTVNSGSFVIGTQYTIATIGTTNFVSIGASANTVGIVFTATGVGSGTGTATTNKWISSQAPSSGIGNGQTWQNVTGSRSGNVNYTNSTGKPIQVMITTYKVGSSAPTTFFVDSVSIGYADAAGTNDVGNFTTTSFIVPDSSTYQAAGDFQQWAELR